MSMVQVNFRMEEELKKDMESLCDKLGLNLTTAITIFAKKMVREQRIPFDVSLTSFAKEPEKQVIIWKEDPPEGEDPDDLPDWYEK